MNAGSALRSNVFKKVPQVFPYCTETGGSVGPSVYELHAKCEHSRWSRSHLDCSQPMELLDGCLWSFHMCSTHLHHNIWLNGLLCLKLIPALRGHSSNVTSHGVHIEWSCKEADEDNWRGHGQTGHNGGSNKRFVYKTSQCVYMLVVYCFMKLSWPNHITWEDKVGKLSRI